MPALMHHAPRLRLACGWLACTRPTSFVIPVLQVGALGLACVPPQTGAAGLILGRPAQGGLRGAALDAFRLVLGTRLLSNALATLMVPLPLPVAAVTNAATVLLTRNNEQLCQTEVGAVLCHAGLCCAMLGYAVPRCALLPLVMPCSAGCCAPS